MVEGDGGGMVEGGRGSQIFRYNIRFQVIHPYARLSHPPSPRETRRCSITITMLIGVGMR